MTDTDAMTRPPVEPLAANERAALQEFAAKATPGPWVDVPAEKESIHPAAVIDSRNSVLLWWAFRQGNGQPDRDVAYIAAANPQTIQRLLATLRAAEARADAAVAVLRELQSSHFDGAQYGCPICYRKRTWNG